jgi:hypothetical protein
MIIDGMDQSHSKMPYLGTQSSFGSNALSQCITGVLVHGVGVSIYRSFETVVKGADLTIHCILSEIEKFALRNNGLYPEEIYLQLDGGAENANKFVLSMLEYLVSSRICKEILYSRLPTGHSHEDIDAVFGNIWKAMRLVVLIITYYYNDV